MCSNLYKSSHFVLSEIRVSGKKETGGILCFEGLPSVYGSAKEVCALEDGVVLKAGWNKDIHSREHRQGVIVMISGKNGVTVTYGRLACRYVNVGDYVHAGDVIGIEGSTGSGTGEYLTLEFRRNGRRVSGCEYLGIPPETGEFKPPHEPAAAIVCRICDIPDEVRSYINQNPEASLLWEKVLAAIGR